MRAIVEQVIGCGNPEWNLLVVGGPDAIERSLVRARATDVVGGQRISDSDIYQLVNQLGRRPGSNRYVIAGTLDAIGSLVNPNPRGRICQTDKVSVEREQIARVAAVHMELKIVEFELSAVAQDVQTEVDGVAELTGKGRPEVRARVDQAFP